jgi:hypothetical protein
MQAGLGCSRRSCRSLRVGYLVAIADLMPSLPAAKRLVVAPFVVAPFARPCTGAGI